MVLPKTAGMPEMELEWKVPEKSNAIERDRARTYHQAYSALVALHCLERAFDRGPRRADEVLARFQGSRGCGQRRLPRGRTRRDLPPHGDRGRQGRQLSALSADAVERQRPRHLRDSRAPTRTRCRTRRSSRRTAPRTSRASTSCGRCGASIRACRAACTCTPASGKVRKVQHTPTGHVLSRGRRRGASAETGRRRRALVERFQELSASLERIDDPRARERAQELIGVVIDLYGEGLSGSSRPSRRGGSRHRGARGAGRRRRRRQPDADPRPLPGRSRDAGGRGPRRSPALYGIPRRRRGAASSSRGRGADPAEGSCDGCPASAATLELAIKQALDEHAPDLEALEVEGTASRRRCGAERHRAADRAVGGGARRGRPAMPVMPPTPRGLRPGSGSRGSTASAKVS